MKQFKTDGFEWLRCSLIAFNGTAYADRGSAEGFLNSYKAWKTLKRDTRALRLLESHWFDALTPAFILVTESQGASAQASKKMMAKFIKYYPKAKAWQE
jgi:hypothetical protein